MGSRSRVRGSVGAGVEGPGGRAGGGGGGGRGGPEGEGGATSGELGRSIFRAISFGFWGASWYILCPCTYVTKKVRSALKFYSLLYTQYINPANHPTSRSCGRSSSLDLNGPE